jgi:hypothetical protein
MPSETVELVSSLIPYGFELLDERSGYPARIRDQWQQRLWQTARATAMRRGWSRRASSDHARRPPARACGERARCARRGGGRESRSRCCAGWQHPDGARLVEAVTTALTHGELLGRSVVARAIKGRVVGRHRGHLAPQTPRSSLPHVFALMDELRLRRATPRPSQDLRPRSAALAARSPPPRRAVPDGRVRHPVRHGA